MTTAHLTQAGLHFAVRVNDDLRDVPLALESLNDSATRVLASMGWRRVGPWRQNGRSADVVHVAEVAALDEGEAQ